MRDRGSHSHECATADGGACHCECNGTQHGIVHVPGKKPGDKHGHEVKIVAVRGDDGKTYHRVTTKDGRPPGGGTKEERLAHRAAEVKVVATTKRTPTLPPPVADKARKVREGLPKTRDEWDATIPREKVVDTFGRDGLAKADRAIASAKEQQQEVVDRVRTSMRGPNYGYPGAKVKRETTHDKMMKYADYNRLQGSLDYWTKYRADVEANIARIEAKPGRPAYPLDKADKWKMPPPELDKHLDAVLDVGREALAAVKAEFERDDEHKALRDRVDAWRKIKARSDAVWEGRDPDAPPAPPLDPNRPPPAPWDPPAHPPMTFARKQQLRDEIRQAQDEMRKAHPGSNPADDEIALRRRERGILREVIAAHRSMGGVRHNAKGLGNVEARAVARAKDPSGTSMARDDWQVRLAIAEEHYPADWLRISAEKPIEIVSAKRAYHRNDGDKSILAMPAQAHGYRGGFNDSVDEVTVHELGHRMEMMIPGLTALEFAYVRRRSTKPNGKLENTRKLKNIYKGGGYRDDEVAFEDQWKNAYAGKTYETGINPAGDPWEVFQVGTQDLYGRSGDFDEGDGLQAFTLGVLLTLA